MRARFDEHAAEIDMVKAKKLLVDGEKELFVKQHPQRVRCELPQAFSMALSVSLGKLALTKAIALYF